MGVEWAAGLWDGAVRRARAQTPARRLWRGRGEGCRLVGWGSSSGSSTDACASAVAWAWSGLPACGMGQFVGLEHRRLRVGCGVGVEWAAGLWDGAVRRARAQTPARRLWRGRGVGCRLVECCISFGAFSTVSITLTSLCLDKAQPQAHMSLQLSHGAATNVHKKKCYSHC
jgi:hypothetical protein